MLPSSPSFSLLINKVLLALLGTPLSIGKLRKTAAETFNLPNFLAENKL